MSTRPEPTSADQVGGAAGPSDPEGESGSAARWAELFAELGAPSSGAADPAGGVPTGGECAEALGQMFEYLDGELTDRTANGRIAEHLGLCTTCLAAYDTEKLVRAALVRSCRAETASVELRARISVLIRAGDTTG